MLFSESFLYWNTIFPVNIGRISMRLHLTVNPRQKRKLTELSYSNPNFSRTDCTLKQYINWHSAIYKKKNSDDDIKFLQDLRKTWNKKNIYTKELFSLRLCLKKCFRDENDK